MIYTKKQKFNSGPRDFPEKVYIIKWKVYYNGYAKKYKEKCRSSFHKDTNTSLFLCVFSSRTGKNFLKC